MCSNTFVNKTVLLNDKNRRKTQRIISEKEILLVTITDGFFQVPVLQHFF